MKSPVLAFAGCLALLLAVPSSAQGVRADELAGWWTADPAWGGETSQVAMQFIEKDGKQEAHLSLPAIGAYDINLGEVAITGDQLDTRGLSFPLAWNAATRTLSGVLPADAAPVYRIPVEFRRGEPLVKPPANEWQAPRPRVVWSVDTGGSAIWAGIERADDGTLYVASESGVLNAIGHDGKVRWKFEAGKAVRAQPRVLGGSVYLHSDSGYLHRLDAKSGAEIWRARVDTGSDPRLPTNEKGTRWDRYGSSVVADRKHVYVASRDKHLYALDLKSGREAWRVAAGDIMTATPALYRDLVIFAAYDGKVSAVAARDGAPRWTFDAKLAVPGDLTVSGDRVLLGSRSYDLIALNAATGREQWRRYYWFSWIESPPVVRDGVIYTGSSDATNIYAIDLADGALRWKTAVPGYSWQRTAVNSGWVVAGTTGAGAFPGSRAGSLVALDRATGAIRWIHLDPPSGEAANKAWGFGASPVIADGVVYAADLGGRVYAIELDHAVAPPPCGSKEHRQFDFWLGEWQVHRPDGALAGINRITREYGGCVIHERYATGRGYSGESLNVYDSARKVWHQTWVDDSGTLLTLEGHWNGKSMVLEGLAPDGNGVQFRQRITFTPNADGTVRQLWETADAQGVWTAVFDGKYSKK